MTYRTFGAQAVSRQRPESNLLATLFFVCGFVHISTWLRHRNTVQRPTLGALLSRQLQQRLTGLVSAFIFF